MKKSINIFGSTGTIGSKTLKIINEYFPNIKINLLTANQNYKKLSKQIYYYKPRYIYLSDESKYRNIKNEINNSSIKFFNKSELFDYLNLNKTDLTILSISGYKALNYLEPIIKNTKNLGIVNKECIVSAGNIIKILCKKFDTEIHPLDSEHFSIQNFINLYTNFDIKNLKNLFLTASGGPLLNKEFKEIKFAKFKNVIQHPKWIMGYKNSIDSSSLANKCLEIIEAHYLFDINYDKLEIIIHPQSLIHSIFEFNNLTSCMNYFYHDMFIPLFNFLNISSRSFKSNVKNSLYNFKKESELHFFKPNNKNFPILKTFNDMNKYQHKNIINFNTGNEYAVELFSKGKIIFGDIDKIIQESLTLDPKIKLNNIKNIIMYQNELIKILKDKTNHKYNL